MPACLPDWMCDCLDDFSLACMTIVHRVNTSLIVVKFTARSVTLEEEEEVVEDEERAETCLSLFLLSNHGFAWLYPG